MMDFQEFERRRKDIKHSIDMKREELNNHKKAAYEGMLYNARLLCIENGIQKDSELNITEEFLKHARKNGFRLYNPVSAHFGGMQRSNNNIRFEVRLRLDTGNGRIITSYIVTPFPIIARMKKNE